MSSVKKPRPDTEELSESAVADYLRTHPDFFDSQQQLLGSLRVPHRTGSAVSLVERQVSALRQKNLQLERKLRDLVDVARSNDALADKMHELARRLLAAENRTDTVLIAEELLRTSFNAERSVLVLFAGDGCTGIDTTAVSRRFLRVIDRSDPALGPFRTFLENDRPRCGRIRDSQRQFLFAADADEIGSAALVPLGSGGTTGFLAIGSTRADYFNPGQSMDFLGRLGDLLGCALRLR